MCISESVYFCKAKIGKTIVFLGRNFCILLCVHNWMAMGVVWNVEGISYTVRRVGDIMYLAVMLV